MQDSSQYAVVVCLLFATGGMFSDQRHPSRSAPPHLTVTVSQRQGDTLSLQVALSLDGDRPVRIDRLGLPWEGSYALILAAAELPRGWPLRRGPFPIEDVTPSDIEVTLSPGKPLVGTVDLRQRFVDLASAAHQSDIIVFWSYELSGTIDNRTAWTSARISGAVVIKRMP